MNVFKKYWGISLASLAAGVFLVGILFVKNPGSAGQFASNDFAAGEFARGVFASGEFAAFAVGAFSIGVFSIVAQWRERKGSSVTIFDVVTAEACFGHGSPTAKSNWPRTRCTSASCQRSCVASMWRVASSS